MELNATGLDHSFPVAGGSGGFRLGIGALLLRLGEATFIMGHNGSGKSVLLKLLAGELRTLQPVRVSLAGEEWTAGSERCGIVRQRAEESLAVELTVAENLMLRLPTSRADWFRPHRRLRSRAAELVAWHGELKRKLDQPCAELSMGQRQTVAFLAVAARQQPLLLLDEYLSSTDRSTSNLLCRLAKQYARSTPAAVVVVSHDVGLALEQADRIVVLRLGEVLADIRPTDPGWDPRVLASYLVPPGHEDGAGLDEPGALAFEIPTVEVVGEGSAAGALE